MARRQYEANMYKVWFNRMCQRANHIKWNREFWNQAKRHLRRFNGIKPEYFYWFLKECEWRFNGGNHKQLLTELISGVRQVKH